MDVWVRGSQTLDYVVKDKAKRAQVSKYAVDAGAVRAALVEVKLSSWVGILGHIERCHAIWQNVCESHGVFLGKGSVIGNGVRCSKRHTQKGDLESGNHHYNLVVSQSIKLDC